ncbi:MAG: DegV family protein [Firmicutes bacterium]|nr:DegV family protein [Bacillota bacterium]
MSIKVLTDSAADLPPSLMQEYGIEMIPLYVFEGDKEYLDGITLQSDVMFEAMRRGQVFKTAQAEPAAFKERFLEYVKNGQSCIYVGFSSELSATFQSAVIAREEVRELYPDCQIELVDTKCASMGQGLVVYHTAKWVKEGLPLAEVVEKTMHCARHMEHIFTVDDLEYLYRGGRVSRTTAMIGGILNIKPILHVEKGRLVPLERVRGKNKVIRRMLEIMRERGRNLKEQTIGISHGDDLESANKLMEAIRKEFGCHDFIMNPIGCAVGAHAGPGTLALFFQNA